MARMTARKARIAELVALLMEEDDAPAQPRRKAAKPKNTFYTKVIKARVPCSYGVAKCGRFAPNGVGSVQHTTCPKGRAAMAKAAK